MAFSWGRERVRSIDYNPYPQVSILHKSKMMGSRPKAGHKILCYDPPAGRHRDFEIAWRGLPKRQRQCVEVRFVNGSMIGEDGRLLTKCELANICGVSPVAFRSNVQYGLQKIEYIITL